MRRLMALTLLVSFGAAGAAMAACDVELAFSPDVVAVPLQSERHRFTLDHPWPNPANPLTSILQDIAVPGIFQIDIHDLRGGLVYKLHEGYLPTGVYLVRVVSGPLQQTRRFTLVR